MQKNTSPKNHHKVKSQQEENINLICKPGENWLASYITIITASLISISSFMSSAAWRRSINPEDWGIYIAAPTIVTSVLFATLGTVIYLARENGETVNKIIPNIININEYSGKKYLDFILSHYGNVCSISALTAAALLLTRESIKPLGSTVSSVVAGLIASALILTYTVKLLKTVSYIFNEKIKTAPILPVMIFMDKEVISMVVRSIPK